MNKEYWKGKAFSVGYKPSKKNKNLYYKKTDVILYFLNFDYHFQKFGYTFYKTEYKNGMLRCNFPNYKYPLTFKTIKEIPEWKRNRLLIQEKKRLGITGFNIFFADCVPHKISSLQNQTIYGDFYIDQLYLDLRFDGYCKLCNLDIQKNSLLCEGCRKNQKSLFIEEAKQFLAKQINIMNACIICGKKLYCPIDHLIYTFCLHNYKKYYFNDASDGYNILRKLNGYFKLYNEQKFLINHHLCYYDEVTIDVCPSCHARIHHSKDESYKQYRPIDKRIDINSS